ncbi:2-dehydro-3-deoxygalactonokinase [Celeribacter indicus]|uniref:2-dehydro-3-deoxygalactonokinase n=1 Tax=Celeribacter indicus TaxID=1208324 RepID=UPI00130E9A29|nr:2-dehydro-3-deoxygalactonokinase [Celeribacter indicus]
MAKDCVAAYRDGAGIRLWSLDTGAELHSVGLDDSLADLVAGTVDAATARALPCAPLPERVGRQIPCLLQADPLTTTDGAEVILAGFLARSPKFDGVICLPGPMRTLWAHVSAGEVVSVRAQMTGALLCAVLPGAEGCTGEAERFVEAVSDGMSRPEFTSQRLASLATAVALRRMSQDEATGLATAWLTGLELAATRAYWLGQPVALIGTQAARAPYAAALEAQFVPLNEADRDEMLLAGFRAARERMSA